MTFYFELKTSSTSPTYFDSHFCWDALGDTLGNALGNTLGNALRNALGDALGDTFNVKKSKNVFPGPELPVTISRHNMIPLGNGQAIIGGTMAPGANGYNSEIYFLNCVNSNLTHSNLEVSVLNQTLSFPRRSFLAIPIPDIISGCISGGKIN